MGQRKKQIGWAWPLAFSKLDWGTPIPAALLIHAGVDYKWAASTRQTAETICTFAFSLF